MGWRIVDSQFVREDEEFYIVELVKQEIEKKLGFQKIEPFSRNC